MANNKSTKSRTSKNRLSKKNSAPHWVIGIVLAIVVATGAFLVYQSFASSSGSETTPIGTSTLYCNSRDCYMTPGPGRTASTRYVATGGCHFNLVWASNSKSGSRVWRCVLP